MNTIAIVKEVTHSFFQLHWPQSWGEAPHWSPRWQMQLGIENPRLPGCYALFDTEGSLAYVGKGSRRADAGIARRLTDHVVNTERRNGPYSLKEKWVDRNIADVHTLAFANNQSYLALALEAHLIRKLTPKFNVQRA